MPKWEYRVLSLDTDGKWMPDAAELDRLGDEGWELVADVKRTYAHGLIFKRPVAEL